MKLTDEALSSLIGDYAREAGVRNLEKLIDKIFRKAAFKLVSGVSKTVNVTTKKVRWLVSCVVLCSLTGGARQLQEFVGQAVFRSDRYYEDPLPLGVVTGLAWTRWGKQKIVCFVVLVFLT